MHKFIIPILTTLFSAAIVTLPTPAAAVDGEAAAIACEKRPKHCNVNYGEGGDLIINVCNDGSGCRTINCPPKGACVFAAPKGGGKTVAGSPGKVMGTLAGPTKGREANPPKKIGATAVKPKKISDERHINSTTGHSGSKKH